MEEQQRWLQVIVVALGRSEFGTPVNLVDVFHQARGFQGFVVWATVANVEEWLVQEKALVEELSCGRVPEQVPGSAIDALDRFAEDTHRSQ